MGNSFACICSQKAKRSKNLSSNGGEGLQYLDSEQLSVLNSMHNLKKKTEKKKKKKKKGELKGEVGKANSRKLRLLPENNEGGVSRISMVLTKEEAALLLLMLRENDSVGGVSFGFCGGLGSPEWKPSLQSIEEEDEFC